MTTTDIYIKITAECECDSYYADCFLEIKNETLSLEDIVDNLEDYRLSKFGLHRIGKTKSGQFSEKTIKELKRYGWVHKDTVLLREERKVLSQEYYLLDTKTNHTPMEKIDDLENLTDIQINALATESKKIVQVVTNKSILPNKIYKKVQSKKRSNEKAAKTREANRAQKEADKKKKEIEAAKQLLLKEGETL